MDTFTLTHLETSLADVAAVALEFDEPGIASMLFLLMESMGYNQEMALITIMNLYNTNILRAERKERHEYRIMTVIEMPQVRPDNQYQTLVPRGLRNLSVKQVDLIEYLRKIQNNCLDNRHTHIAIAIAIMVQTFQSNQDKQLLDMMIIYNQDTLKPLRSHASVSERENWRVNP